jgi:hypothetical protein
MIVQLSGEQRFQRLTGALVQLFAAFDQQRVIGDLLGQRVLENVLEIGCGRPLVNELTSL